LEQHLQQDCLKTHCKRKATINWLIVFLQYRDHHWMSRLREASTLFEQLVL